MNHRGLSVLGSVARNAIKSTKGSSQAAFKKFRDVAKKDWLQTGKRLTVQ